MVVFSTNAPVLSKFNIDGLAARKLRGYNPTPLRLLFVGYKPHRFEGPAPHSWLGRPYRGKKRKKSCPVGGWVSSLFLHPRAHFPMLVILSQ